jgi:RNA polymerase sigma-70 factor (ECF subfamily)
METSVVISDAVLVSNYIKGDEAALATLIKKHQSKIYGFIYSKIGDRDIRLNQILITKKGNSYLG